MSVSAIRTRIKAKLSAVEGIGIVHEYQRWASTWSKFLSQFKTESDVINGWMITRRATPSARDTMPTLNRGHVFILTGFYGLNDDDATELVFQDMVEDIQDAFDSDVTLGGLVLKSGPLQVKVVENRTFGNVLCHYAELELVADERKTYS